MLRKLIFSIVAFASILFTFNTAYSSARVELPDTTIPRGRVYQIPIYGSVDEQNIISMTINLEFDAHILDVKGLALINENTLFTNGETLTVTLDLSNLTKATASITSMNVNPGEGIFCYIEVEGLAGPDSVTEIKAVEALKNGQPIDEAEMINGVVKVPGLPILPGFTEDLGQNNPNPFSGYTKLDFSISKPTQIEFFIYAIDGRLVGKIPSDNNSFHYDVFKGSAPFELERGKEVSEGNYQIMLTPHKSEFAAGLYFIVMQTSNGVYKQNFMYIK